MSLDSPISEGESPSALTERDDRPPWPPWFAPAGLAGGLAVAVLALALVSVPVSLISGPEQLESPAFNFFGTVVQNIALIAVAVGLAATVRRPRPSDFGLRRTRLWRAVGWTVAAILAFYVFSAVYGLLVEPTGEQSTLRDLGADRSRIGLVAATVLVVGMAPLIEEVFHRGFFYGALRTRLPVWLAVLIAGLFFGSLHYTGPQTLDLLPSLAVLGALFCVLYEVTGSLWPPIAMHTFNNAIAFAVQISDRGEAGLGVAVETVLTVAGALARA